MAQFGGELTANSINLTRYREVLTWLRPAHKAARWANIKRILRSEIKMSDSIAFYSWQIKDFPGFLRLSPLDALSCYIKITDVTKNIDFLIIWNGARDNCYVAGLGAALKVLLLRQPESFSTS